MHIIPQRLRKARLDQNLSRKALAERARVSERQIQRLEDPEQASRNVRNHTVTQLADALGVGTEQLTGVRPMSDDTQTVRIGPALVPGVALAYELIERRYKVTLGEVINMAPLLFAVVAEQSLAWRNVEAERINDAADRLVKLASSRMRVALHGGNAVNEVGHEWEAISRPDLFNDPFPADYDFFPDEDWDGNPSADYLRMLVEELEPFWGELGDSDAGPGRIRFETYDRTGAVAPRVPQYSVCGDDLHEIAEPHSDALYALHAGDAHLSDIPNELLADEAAEERRAWLEDRLSPKSRDWLRTLKSMALKLEDL